MQVALSVHIMSGRL